MTKKKEKKVTKEGIGEAAEPTNTCGEENLKKMVEESPKEGQPSPGGLTEHNEPSKYRNIGWTTEVVAIDQINHFTRIPDYVQKTQTDRPSVAKTPQGYFCLDGWDLVEFARSQGATTILVDVDNMAEHSEEELCIRKMVLRLKTRGDATYVEIARNSRDIYLMLRSTNENLKEYSHGGRRDRDALAGNREEDAAEVLARRIRKDRDTVLKHVHHCKYLSDDTIQFFIEKVAPKKFFEVTQAKKRILVTELDGKSLPNIEKTAAISTFMIEAFEKYTALKADGNGQPAGSPPPPAAATPSVTPKEDPKSTEDEENDEKDTPHSDPEVTSIEPVTTKKIFQNYQEVSKRIAEDLTKGISISDMKTRLQEEMNMILKLLNMIDSLDTAGK